MPTSVDDPHVTAITRHPPYEFRRRARVVWTDGEGPHERVLAEKTLVGSATGVGLVVRDPTVSRIHAEFEPVNEGMWVRDLGSRNGTFVGDSLVTAARVTDGARIRLGSTVFTVRYGSDSSALEIWPEHRFGQLIGRSVAMRALFQRLHLVAATESSVLIQGETGTGKELVASAIHLASPRAKHPFVVVDCAALPDTLLESELFGHMKGSFTGAVATRAGAIEEADGGTVFLDEVGELPLAMQPKLLRMLESRTIRRVGETAHRKVDVRIVSATHRDLRTMVNAGAFREDLYFRLAVVPVTIPPLRERSEDIALLVERFAPSGRLGPDHDELLQTLVGRPWLGNVRELRNFVERAFALGAREALELSQSSSEREMPTPATTPTGLPRPSRGTALPATAPRGANSALPIATSEPFKTAREQWLDLFEREYIAALLARHDRNIADVAQAAGVDRTYVYRLVRKHNL